MAKGRKSKYFAKLAACMLLVSILPLLTIGGLSFRQFNQLAERHIQDTKGQTIMQIGIRLDGTLKVIDYMTTQYLSTRAVASALNSELTPQEFILQSELLSGMNRIQAYELGIYNISFINEARGWVLNSFGKHTLEEVPSINALLSVLHEIAKKPFWSMKDKLFIRREGRETPSLAMAKRIPVTALGPSAFLVVEFIGKDLSDVLYRGSTEDEYMILGADGTILAHRDPVRIGSMDEALWEGIVALREGEKGFNLHVEGEKRLTVVHRSEYSDLIYVSLSSEDPFLSGYHTLFRTVLLSGLLVLALALIVSLMGSHRMYVPVRRLYGMLPQPDAAQEKRRWVDEFQFIDNRMKDLFANNQVLRNTIESQSEQLREFFLRRFLLGELEESEAERLMESYYPGQKEKVFFLLAYQIHGADASIYREEDTALLHFALRNILGELIPHHLAFGSAWIANAQVVLLAGSGDVQPLRAQANRLAEQTHKILTEHLHIQLTVGVADPTKDVFGLPEAYEQACEALRQRGRNGGNVVIYYEQLQSQSRTHWKYPKALERRLTDAIVQNDTERAAKCLHDCIVTIFKDSPSLSTYQVQMHCLFAALLGIACESDFNVESLGMEQFAKQILEMKTPEEVFQWFFGEVVQPLAQHLDTKRSLESNRVSEWVKGYIMENLQSNIGLESCADQLKYHPNYISRVFKEQTGMSYSEFLSQRRLEQAKTWLNESDMKIAEIADRLQYNNAQNFIRFFKKMEGITPGQYRDGAVGQR